VRGVALTIGLCAVLLAGAAHTVREGGSEAHASPAARGPEALARAVTPGRLRAHLVALEAIARRNGGSRAAGGPGYQHSVAYVAGQLRAAGYRPRLQSFSFDLFRETRPPRFERLDPEPAQYSARRDFLTLRYSGSGTVTGQVAPVEPDSATSGCEPADFAAFPRGAVALLRRGTCFFTAKAQNARSAGASAVLIANEGVPGRTAPIAATLVRPGIGIPVLMVSSALGSELAQSAQAGRVRVRIAVSAVSRTARAANVIADLPGRRSGTVLLGAHLDSVANGPGINDNGSGSALVLEVARQARRLGVRPARGLRFAFWGAEELGLVGSTAYVQSLSARERQQLHAVLNFDMVGSKNFGRFVYDGSTAPPGSARIEDAFRAYFAAHRQTVEELSLGGGSDHAPFARAGLPVGGLFTGADARKAAGLVSRFGGVAGRPFDPCYHQACDTVSNVNVRILGQMADAAAVVALRLAS
jgi:Peptidase family M28/PA domain